MADRYEDRYAGDPYTTGRGFARNDRNILERAGNEVRSWFGRREHEPRHRTDESDYERDRDRDRWTRRDITERGGESSRGYESTHDYGYSGGRDDLRTARDHGVPERWSEHAWTPDRGTERDWRPERWERTDRWSGERPGTLAPGINPYSAWHERDDRYVAPGDYRDWTRQGLGWTPGRQTESRGVYEDDRGRVHQFEHGTDDFRGRGPKGYRRSDERIREDVCERLTDDWRIDATDVEVVVNDGEVTLSGVVNSRGAKRHAEDLVEDITGVRDVHNNLRVSTSQ